MSADYRAKIWVHFNYRRRVKLPSSALSTPNTSLLRHSQPMFVPRALRLRGVKEAKKDDGEPPAKKRRIAPLATKNPNTGNATTSAKQSKRGSMEPSTTSSSFNAEYLGFLTAGVELIFTDYAMQSEEGDAWLRKHYRNLDGTPGVAPAGGGKRLDSIDNGMCTSKTYVPAHTLKG